jgi:hypothetical protein
LIYFFGGSKFKFGLILGWNIYYFLECGMNKIFKYKMYGAKSAIDFFRYAIVAIAAFVLLMPAIFDGVDPNRVERNVMLVIFLSVSWWFIGIHKLQRHLYTIQVTKDSIKFVRGNRVVVETNWDCVTFTTIHSRDRSDIPFLSDSEVKGLAVMIDNNKYFILKYINKYSELVDIIKSKSSIRNIF